MPTLLRWTLLSMATLGTPFALADETEAPNLTEDTFLADVPLVLGATRLSQPVSESPAAMTVIDREMIVASGALDIPEVLRLVPGFQVAHVNGHWYAVTYHGLSDAYARRMQVLIDGRSVYTPAFGGVFWSDIPLAIEDIDRIEVIRGPNGATYGANSFSAVVNIITRHSSQDPGFMGQYTWDVAADGYRDLHTKKGVLRYGGSAGDFSYRTTVGYRQDQGLPDTSDNKKVKLATFRGDLRVGPKDTLEVQLGYNGGARGDGSEEGDTSEPARDRDVVNHFQQLRWKHLTSASEELSLQFYHNYRRNHDVYMGYEDVNTDGPPPIHVSIAIPRNEDYWDERFDLELQHIFSPAQDWRVVWGAEARLDRLRGPDWFGSEDYLTSRLYRLFANGEWRLRPDTIVNIGSMYEWNDFTGGDFSPRLGINYHVVPGQTLRASVSRAYRTPSYLEGRGSAETDVTIVPLPTIKVRELIGNESLRPERITAYEAGWRSELSKWRATTDLKIFREEIRDMISMEGNEFQLVGNESLPIIAFNNDGEATTSGAELELSWNATDWTELHMSAAYAKQHGYSITRTVKTVEYTDTRPYTPVRTYGALLMQRLPGGFEASTQYTRTSEVLWTGHEPARTSALDVRLAYNVRHGRVRTKYAVVGQNLRHTYYDYHPDVVLDRRLLFTVGIELR